MPARGGGDGCDVRLPRCPPRRGWRGLPWGAGERQSGLRGAGAAEALPGGKERGESGAGGQVSGGTSFHPFECERAAAGGSARAGKSLTFRSQSDKLSRRGGSALARAPVTCGAAGGPSAGGGGGRRARGRGRGARLSPSAAGGGHLPRVSVGELRIRRWWFLPHRRVAFGGNAGCSSPPSTALIYFSCQAAAAVRGSVRMNGWFQPCHPPAEFCLSSVDTSATVLL